MPTKYEEMTTLYQQTRKSLLNLDNWRRFLAFAARSFKLPFAEQLLVYAQRPEATALMPIGDWNTAYGRFVNKGCHGIAVLDKQRLKYYYDISDTHGNSKSKPVPLWSVRPEHHRAIVRALIKYLGKLEDTSNFGDALVSAAKRVVACTVDDRMETLRGHKKNSLLEELDDDNLELTFRTAMENSVAYMLLTRCGVDPAPYLVEDDFFCVLNFNTPSTLNILGTAVTETAAMCLGVIARTVRGMQAAAPVAEVPQDVALAPAVEESAPKKKSPAKKRKTAAKDKTGEEQTTMPPEPVRLEQPTPSYAVGDRFTIAGASEFAITEIGADKVSYSFVDLPEQEPVSASRKEFDQWLAAGFLQPVPAAVPA